jgi:hypothetical protein
MGISAAHVDVGLGTGKVDDFTTGTLDLRLGVALCRWPSLTFGIAASGPLFHTTGYIPPGNTSRSELDALAIGLNVVKRWELVPGFEILTGGIVGALRAEYPFRDGIQGRSSTWFATDEAGIEARLPGTMHLYALVGHRFTGPLATPGIGPRGLAGPVASLMAAFGQF